MSGIRLPTDLSDRYELLADELDGFDDARELVGYVLEATADEIERGGVASETVDATPDTDDSAVGAGDANGRDGADDDVVADRLEQLGYLEK